MEKNNNLYLPRTSDFALGIFDSGLGGLSVLNTVRELMPNERLIYYGDSAFAPYGTKPLNEVRDRVFCIVEELMKIGVKALVIACNTATSAAVHILRERYKIPIFGIEPALKPAVESGAKNILVLATEITLKEKKFAYLMDRFKERANIIKAPASCLVDLVENDEIEEDKVNACLNNVLTKLGLSDLSEVDAVVLGCTHFLFAKNEVSSFFKGAEIFDGNLGLAKHLKRALEEKNLMNLGHGECKFGSDFGKVEALTFGRTLLLSSKPGMVERYKKYAR